MNDLECFGCVNIRKQLNSGEGPLESHGEEGATENKLEESFPTMGSHHSGKAEI